MSTLTNPLRDPAERLAASCGSVAEAQAELLTALRALRRALQTPATTDGVKAELTELRQASEAGVRVVARYLAAVLAFDCGLYGDCREALKEADNALACWAPGEPPSAGARLMAASVKARQALLAWRTGEYRSLVQTQAAFCVSGS